MKCIPISVLGAYRNSKLDLLSRVRCTILYRHISQALFDGFYNFGVKFDCRNFYFFTDVKLRKHIFTSRSESLCFA